MQDVLVQLSHYAGAIARGIVRTRIGPVPDLGQGLGNAQDAVGRRKSPEGCTRLLQTERSYSRLRVTAKGKADAGQTIVQGTVYGIVNHHFWNGSLADIRQGSFRGQPPGGRRHSCGDIRESVRRAAPRLQVQASCSKSDSAEPKGYPRLKPVKSGQPEVMNSGPDARIGAFQSIRRTCVRKYADSV